MTTPSSRAGYVDLDRPLTRNGTMIMPALDLYRELSGYDEETVPEDATLDRATGETPHATAVLGSPVGLARAEAAPQHLGSHLDGDLVGDLTRDLAHELDELSLVLDARAQHLQPGDGDEQPTLDHAPHHAQPADPPAVEARRERVHPQRRMTLAALRALPARISTLPPPPPGRSTQALAAAEAATVQGPAVTAAVTEHAAPMAAARAAMPVGSTTMETIAPMPIISVGEDFGARTGAPAHATHTARASTTVIPPPLPAFVAAAPVHIPAPRPFPSAAAFANAQRSSLSSIAPTSFAIASEETVEVRLQNKRRSRGRIAAAVGIWMAVAAGVALVATGRLGQRPAAGTTPESAPVAAQAAAPVQLAPAAAPEPAAPAAPAAVDSETDSEREAAAAVQAAAEPAAVAAPAAGAEPAAVAATAAGEPAVVAASAPAKPVQAGAWPAATAATGKKDPQIQIDSVFFGHTADDRSVTMQLDGKTVIVREGDVAEDVVVEKIMKDGVILRRGNRKFAVYAQE